MFNEFKIYFDNRFLLLTRKGNQIPEACKILTFDPSKIAEQIAEFSAPVENTVTTAASADTAACLCIVHDDPSEVFAALQACFKPIEAAGGVVSRPDGRVLLIRRLGKWDLPKGKAEDGETPEQTAVREVVEECGLAEKPVITEKLADTYHTYHLKGEHILKHTSWFAMQYSGNETLQPQYSEDISQALWCTDEKLRAACADTYGSVNDVLNIAQQNSKKN